jgi:hypothetical protein
MSVFITTNYFSNISISFSSDNSLAMRIYLSVSDLSIYLAIGIRKVFSAMILALSWLLAWTWLLLILAKDSEIMAISKLNITIIFRIVQNMNITQHVMGDIELA